MEFHKYGFSKISITNLKVFRVDEKTFINYS